MAPVLLVGTSTAECRQKPRSYHSFGRDPSVLARSGLRRALIIIQVHSWLWQKQQGLDRLQPDRVGVPSSCSKAGRHAQKNLVYRGTAVF